MPFAKLIGAATRHRIRSFDGTEISALEWPGDEDTILFIHATGFHKELWAPVVAALRARGVSARLIAADMRGHGDSGAPGDLSWWDFGKDVVAVMSELSGPGARVGVGHSMGGGAVTGAELLVPGTFGGLVLVDPAIMSRRWLRGMERRMGNPWAEGAKRRRPTFEDRAAARANFGEKEIFSTWAEGVLDIYSEFGLAEGDSGATLKCAPSWEARTFSCPDIIDIWPRIDELRCAATLVTGQESVTHVPEHAVDSAKQFGGRHVRLPGVGHFIPMEAPEWLSAEIDRMLRSVSA